MIKETDLLEAIAECQGERNPNANTCIKLAAYYTILDHIKSKEKPVIEDRSYSYDPPTEDAEQPFKYSSKSEFGELISELDLNQSLRIIDELMETLRIMCPKLYDATIRQLTALK